MLLLGYWGHVPMILCFLWDNIFNDISANTKMPHKSLNISGMWYCWQLSNFWPIKPLRICLKTCRKCIKMLYFIIKAQLSPWKLYFQARNWNHNHIPDIWDTHILHAMNEIVNPQKKKVLQKKLVNNIWPNTKIAKQYIIHII